MYPPLINYMPDFYSSQDELGEELIMEASSNNKSRISIGFTYNKKPALQHCKAGQYSERESNPHSFNGNRILSPACLPVPPSEQLGFVNETANLDKFAFICNLIMLNLRSLPFCVRN